MRVDGYLYVLCVCAPHTYVLVSMCMRMCMLLVTGCLRRCVRTRAWVRACEAGTVRCERCGSEVCREALQGERRVAKASAELRRLQQLRKSPRETWEQADETVVVDKEVREAEDNLRVAEKVYSILRAERLAERDREKENEKALERERESQMEREGKREREIEKSVEGDRKECQGSLTRAQEIRTDT